MWVLGLSPRMTVMEMLYDFHHNQSAATRTQTLLS
jgi:hypothetical protein